MSSELMSNVLTPLCVLSLQLLLSVMVMATRDLAGVQGTPLPIRESSIGMRGGTAGVGVRGVSTEIRKGSTSSRSIRSAEQKSKGSGGSALPLRVKPSAGLNERLAAARRLLASTPLIDG